MYFSREKHDGRTILSQSHTFLFRTTRQKRAAVTETHQPRAGWPHGPPPPDQHLHPGLDAGAPQVRSRVSTLHQFDRVPKLSLRTT